MKVKRSRAITWIVVVVLLALWIRVFWFTEVFSTHQRNQPHRAALLQIYEEIHPGASYQDVLTAYWRLRTDRLKLHADHAAEWSVSMPLEFGAGHWYLGVEFQDGRVQAVRVRTSDGPAPKDGPPDKT